MSARSRKHQVERLMWGDSRRCRIGRHGYVHEQNAWQDEQGNHHASERWHCWCCGHWQTSPPIGSALWHFRQWKALSAEEQALRLTKFETHVV